MPAENSPSFPMPVDPGVKPPVPAPPADRSFTVSQAQARSASQAQRTILGTVFNILRGGRGR